MRTVRGTLALLGLILSSTLLPAISAAKDPKEPRELTPDEERLVAQLEMEVRNHAQAGRFEEATKVGERLVVYRAERQGEQHWQVFDARGSVQRWQRLTAVPAEDRAKVGRAIRLHAEHNQLKEQGLHREAAANAAEALDIYRKILGEQHPATAATFNDLANCLDVMGKHTQAFLLFQKAAEINRKALGEQHHETAVNYHNQGLCLYRQDRYDEALPLFRKALAILQKSPGEQHPVTATAFTNVAGCLKRQGKYAEALPLDRKSLDIRRKLLGEQHADTATSYNNLGSCLLGMGRYAEAFPLQQKALDIYLAVLGEQHRKTAISYSNVGDCLNRQGKHADALPLFQKALAIRRKVLGEQHAETAFGYYALASCMDELGKHADAQRLHQKALEIWQDVLGEQRPDTARGYSGLAHCLSSQGKHAEALPLHRKALSICRSLLGEEHPDTAGCHTNVATCLDALSLHGDALPHHRSALETSRQVFGEQHPQTATISHNLACSLDDQRRHAEALPLHRKALDIRRKLLGEDHPSTAEGYNSTALCLNGQGKHAEALPLFQRGLAIRRQRLGEHRPRTASSYNSLAHCLSRQGMHREAADAWEKALLGHEFGRLQGGTTGFDRSSFQERSASPRSALAATLVHLDQPVRAWEHAEADLARGLLDDLLGSDSDAAEVGKLARLDKLQAILAPLLGRETLTPEETKRRATLEEERDGLLAELARSAVQRNRDRVLPLKDIQKRIPADAAVVFWVDSLDPRLGCVLRHEGPPAWVALPGSGKDNAWTEEDKLLPNLVRVSLWSEGISTEVKQALLKRMPEKEVDLYRRACDPAHGQPLRAALHRQRIAPLEPHLKGVRLLLVISAHQMSSVPVEPLTDRYTVAYIPSATIYARRMGQHRPLEASSLLVLADPVFTRTTPKLPEPPGHGLLVKAITPGSLAARLGLTPGDVLLEYDGKKLTEAGDLKPAAAEERVAFQLWREGKVLQGRIPGGKLGVVVDERPIADALAEWRKEQHQLRTAIRGDRDWAALPGTRLEARTLSALVEKTTALLGSEASERRLDELAAAGKLKEFRMLHLATHGNANSTRPGDTALILAQDNLPTILDDQVQLILSGKKAPDGQLTVGRMLRKDWQLDADLVVLSACETGMGKQTGGEGMLGFTQALLQKGARSVVLSLWKVDDAATALLMERFYRNLLGKRDGLKEAMKRAEALAEAKSWLRGLPRAEAEKRLAVLVDGVPRGERGSIKAALPTRKPDDPKDDRPFAHPYYWAAFVLIGDPFCTLCCS